MARRPQRVDWVDYSKGLTILLVIIMHATYGVEKYMGAEGWMHYLVTFAQPFRMPVFFAVAGLFAIHSLSREWRDFLDGKILHFAYFYMLWMTIQFVFKSPFFIEKFGLEGTLLYYVASYVQPFGLLWFIYLLPIYFLILRLTHKVPVFAQFVLAISCKVMLTETGVNIVDFFSKYYVFFLVGHYGRALWFKLAESAKDHKMSVIFGLAAWAAVNGVIVSLGYAQQIPMAIILGLLGFMAVVSAMAVLPHKILGQTLRYCGQRSLPLYLGFFLPMGVSRLLLPKICEVCDVGLSAFLVSAISIIGALAMYELATKLKIGHFLYNRPQWARLSAKRSRYVPAE